MRRPERLYRLLLRCYPAEFRDEYGGEMTQAFRDEWAGGPRRRWVDLVADVARTAPKEHLHVLANDLRYTARMIAKTPLFSAAVMLTVAVAIGANTAIFSVVNAVILRPLPFERPNRLVQVAEKNDKLNLPIFSASVLNYLSWLEQSKTLQFAAIGSGTFTLGGNGDPEQIVGSRVSPSLLPVLGLRPLSGRTFAAGEDAPGAPRVAMISAGLWKRRFGSDERLVGRAIKLNGIDHTVVGIAPPALGVLTGGDIWTPLTIDPAREIRLNHVITVVGRLRPGVSIEAAQAEMDAVAAQIGRQYPEVRDWGVRLITFYRTFVSTQLQLALVVLLAAVALVLLIACANIANLLLARSASRQKEMAIRTAMGASRSRLLRQLLVESVTLSTIGGIAGVTGALWAVRMINRTLPPNLLPIPEITVDTTVLVFAVGLTVTTGLLFGIVPSLRSARADLNAALKQAGRSSSAVVRPGLRNSLAAAELALATVLLVGAGLLVQTLLHLQQARLGFEANGLLTFQLAPPTARYPLADKAPAFYRALLESFRAVPGVRDAGISSGLPFSAGNYTTTPMATTGTSVLAPDAAVPIDWRIVSPGFFRTMGIPLLRGRDLTDADASASARMIIVSQGTARRFWGDTDPIGRTLHLIASPREMTVVGVVGDIRSTALNQETPTIYFASAAGVWPLMDVVVRTSLPADAVLPSLRQKVRELDPELALGTVRTMDEWLANTAAQPRLNAALLATFAAVAVLIAAIGIYGVLAYSVTQRTHEIGLRMALGARRLQVLRLIVGEGMTVGLAGIAIGLAAALAFSRALSSLLFGVPVNDPFTFAGVAITLTVIALAACTLPARRATRVDPMIALREE